MGIDVSCLCGKDFQVPERFAGKSGKCPYCSAALIIPGVPEPVSEEAAPEIRPPGRFKPKKKGLVRPAVLRARRSKKAEVADPDDADDKAADDDRPRCVVRVTHPAKRVCSELHRSVCQYLKAEGMKGYRFVSHEAGDEEVARGEEDWQIEVRVTKYDLGSQTIRYFLTILAFLGLGDCKLKTDCTLAHGDDEPRAFRANSRRVGGFFGGNSATLMKQNLASVAKRIARQLTGRWILTVEAMELAKWGLILGLIGLVPFLGLFLCLPTLVLGGVSLQVLVQRGLKARRTMAIAALILAVVEAGFSVFLLANAK